VSRRDNSGLDNSLSGNGLDPADQVANPTRPRGVNPINEWFNTQAFVPNAIGTYGNTGVKIWLGPGSRRPRRVPCQKHSSYGNDQDAISGGNIQ
jgi:hypothetical protein